MHTIAARWLSAILVTLLVSPSQSSHGGQLRIGVACTDCLVTWSLFTSSVYNAVVTEVKAQNATSLFAVETLLMDTFTTAEALAEALRNFTHIVASSTLVPNIFVAAETLVQNITITVMDPIEVPSSLTNRTQVIALRDDQVGFLAGVVAGAQSVSGNVAYVGGPRSAAINNMRAGFFSGVLSVCPACSILVTNLGAFSKLSINSTAVVAALRAKGPDVVWTAGGSGGSQVLTQLALAGVEVIGVDADEFTTTLGAYTNTTVATQLLTSSMKLAGEAARVAVRGLIADHDNYVLQNRIIGAQDNAVQLAPCHTSCSRWSGRANDSALMVQRGLQSGRQSTGVNIDTGNIITADRRQTSISVSRVAVSAAQQVELRPGYAQVVSCWGLMVVFDGQWDRLATYDDALMTIVSFLGVTPPSLAPPLGGGHSLVSLTLDNSTSLEAVILVGGYQRGVMSNKSFSLISTCQTPGTCTDYAVWHSVTNTVLAPTIVVPDMAYHAASSRPRTNIFYVAGGLTTNGAALQDIWRVQCRVDNITTYRVLCTWSVLVTTTATFPALYNFSFAVWLGDPSASPAAETSSDVFVLAGGDSGLLAWCSPFTLKPLWVLETAELAPLGIAMPRRPCIYRHDALAVVLLGAGTSGQSIFLRADVTLPASARISVGVRDGLTPSVLATLTQGQLSCDVLQASSEVVATTVAFAGWDTALYHATFRQVLLVDVNSTSSTSGMVAYSMPVLACDAKRHLVRSSSLEQCIICETSITEDDVCSPATLETNDGGSNGLEVGSIIGIVIGVAVAFLAGVLLGCIALGVGVNFRQLRTVPAPLQFPLAFVFVALANTSKSWQREPRAAAHRVKMIRRLVAAAAAKHSCYEVRVVGDSCLLVASNAKSALHFSLALLELRRKGPPACVDNDTADRSMWDRWRPRGDAWPDEVPVRLVVHYGSRVEIRASHGGAFDYYGPDVDEAIAARWCVDGALREVALSAPALEALHTAGVDLERVNGFALTESIGSSSYKILRSVDGGLRKQPSTTDIVVPSTSFGIGPTASLDDVKVDLPDFTMEDDGDAGAGMLEYDGRTSGDRQGATVSGVNGAHSSSRANHVPVDPLHVLNAIETQQLTQIVSWALEAASAPLPEQQRAKFLKRLCHQNIVPYDLIPASTTSKGAGSASPLPSHGKREVPGPTPQGKGVSVTSMSSSTATTTGGALNRVAASLLRQMDTLELRSILTHLSSHADDRNTGDATDEWEASQRPQNRSTGSKGTPLQRAAGREEW